MPVMVSSLDVGDSTTTANYSARRMDTAEVLRRAISEAAEASLAATGRGWCWRAWQRSLVIGAAATGHACQ
uniref:Uncharacterized protein n=1 Tax=Arundo donax TaxID=35708 RepID=A0A0A9BWG1_ARUDO